MTPQNLPSEIAEQIFKLLTIEDLANTSRSCRRLHQIVEPLLYSNFSQNRWAAIPLLLRTLLDKPALVEHIKSLTLFHVSNVDHVPKSREIGEILNIGHFKKLGAKIQDYYGYKRGREKFLGYEMGATPEEMLDSWKFLLQNSEEPGGMAAILLLYLPKIREIKIFTYSIGQLDIYSILETAAKIQKSQHPNTPYSFSNLRKFMIDNCHKRSSYGYTQIKTLPPLLEMPSLRRLSCRKLDLDRRNSEPITLHTPSSVEHLELMECNFTPEVLEPLLLKCPSLTYLRVGFDGYGEDHTNLHLSDLIHSIVHLKGKLRKLVVFDKHHFYGVHHVMRYFPSLAHLQVLQTLKIEGYFVGTDDEHKSQAFTFASLPSSLKKLTIQNAGRPVLIVQLERNAHLLEYVPNLKRICVQFQLQSHHSEANDMLDIENEVWKSFSKSYAQKGVDLWFKICKYTEEDETTQMRTTYHYDRTLYPAWKVVSRLVVEKGSCSACAIG